MDNFNSTSFDDSKLNLSSKCLRSFQEYDVESDDDIIIFDEMKTNECTNPISNMMNDLLVDRAKYNKSYAACIDTSKQLNSVPGAKVQYPVLKQQIKREANLKYVYVRYIFSASCKILCEEGNACEICKQIPKKTKSNYLVYIPLEQQLKNTLDKYLNEILNYMNEPRVPGVIRDIYDSEIYKRINTDDDQHILPFTINMDGAKIFNSSKTTLWPIQVTQGFLPPNIRFLRENILVIALYCGEEKPDMSTIMIPFAKEMKKLQKNGIFLWESGKLYNFVPRVLFCALIYPLERKYKIANNRLDTTDVHAVSTMELVSKMRKRRKRMCVS